MGGWSSVAPNPSQPSASRTEARSELDCHTGAPYCATPGSEQPASRDRSRCASQHRAAGHPRIRAANFPLSRLQARVRGTIEGMAGVFEAGKANAPGRDTAARRCRGRRFERCGCGLSGPRARDCRRGWTRSIRVRRPSSAFRTSARPDREQQRVRGRPPNPASPQNRHIGSAFKYCTNARRQRAQLQRAVADQQVLVSAWSRTPARQSGSGAGIFDSKSKIPAAAPSYIPLRQRPTRCVVL